jgi:hypothetical protein
LPISLGADFDSDLRGMTLGVYEQAFMPVEEQLHGPIGCFALGICGASDARTP